MNMKCRDLSRLKSFENIRLIAGAGGLDHIITWVYINQDSSICDWIHGGELVFITGMENGFSDSTLISIVRECIENAAAGIVVLINPEYIGFIPEEVVSTAENGNMPLYEMPWEIKLVDVTKEIANTIIINQLHEQSVMGFFSELLFSHYISDASIRNMGIRCGVDVDEDASMMIIRPIYKRECQRNDFDNVISALNRAIDNELERHRINYVSYVYMDEIFIYAVCRSNELSGVRDITAAVCNDYAEKYSGLRICGGIGRVTAGAENFRRSYSEARQALSLSEDDLTPVRIVMYSEMGIIRLLTSASSRGEIKDYCYSTLMPLIDSDRQHNTEYIKTLDTYLRCNCNLIKTAETMFIHRNTIVYRVEKIRSLLDIDFSDMTAKSECMNALRFMKHFGFQPEDFE
ncbi:MAG: PucR family transcriptional regulator [Oscillospiraceae bacterium]